MAGTDMRRWLLVLSVALGLMEIADGFRLEVPFAAWIYAGLLLGGSYWLWRSAGRGPVIFLGVLHLVELLLLLFVFRTGDQAPPTWWFVAFVAVSLGGTAAAVMALARGRQRLT